MIRFCLICAALTASVVPAQVTVTNSTNFVNSSFVARFPAGAGQVQLAGSVAYDINLSPVSLYVGAAQLATDAQNLFNAYPSPQDPIEAIVSSVMTALLQKYPQINGGTLTATVLSATNPTAPLITTVYMGLLGPSQPAATSSSTKSLHIPSGAGGASPGQNPSRD